jgi:hypothetical protein
MRATRGFLGEDMGGVSPRDPDHVGRDMLDPTWRENVTA